MRIVLSLLCSFIIGGQALAESPSSAVRSSKVGGLGLRGGLFMGSVPGYGLDGWWQMNPDLQLGAFIGAGGLDMKDDVNSDSPNSRVNATEARADATLFLVQARYFVGNSFHVTGGLGQRTLGLDVRVEDSISREFISGEIDVKSVVAHFAIGNVWSWDSGFYIGADWLAVSVPLSSITSTQVNSSATLSSDLEGLHEDAQDLAVQIGESPTYQLGFLHIGYTF